MIPEVASEATIVRDPTDAIETGRVTATDRVTVTILRQPIPTPTLVLVRGAPSLHRASKTAEVIAGVKRNARREAAEVIHSVPWPSMVALQLFSKVCRKSCGVSEVDGLFSCLFKRSIAVVEADTLKQSFKLARIAGFI